MVNSVVYHTCPSRLSSKIHPFIFHNSWRFYLTPECLPNFLWLAYPTICGENICSSQLLFAVPPPQKNASNLCIFTHASVIHSKLQAEFFENLFPRKTKGVEKTIICFMKSQSKNVKMTWNNSSFIFCMVYNFCKCDGFTVLRITSIK